MGNVHKFTEHFALGYGGKSAALGGESSDVLTFSTWADMKNYDLIVGIAHVVGAASDTVITFAGWQATTSAGAGSKTVTGASDTFTSTNVTDTDVLVAQVRGEDLDVTNSFRYAGFKISTSLTDGTETVGGVVLGGRARYKQGTVPSL